MKKTTTITTAGCCLLVVVSLALAFGVDALLAVLIHAAFHQVSFLQAFVVLIVLSFVFGGAARASS